MQPRERITLEPAFVLHQPRVSRHQPHPRRVQRAPRAPHVVCARRARTEVEARLAADAVPAAAGFVERARRRGAAHRRPSRMAKRCRCRRARCCPVSISTSSSSASRRATIRSRSCSRTTRAALRRLSRRRRAEPTLRVFEKRLLASLGYGLEFSVDARRLTTSFRVGEGLAEVREDAPGAYSGRCLLALRRKTLRDARVARRRAARAAPGAGSLSRRPRAAHAHGGAFDGAARSIA